MFKYFLALCLFPLSALSQKNVISYIIYDGQQYESRQLNAAASSPVIQIMQSAAGNSSYVLKKSSNGHYYVNGEINGYPLTFMIDTGATSTAIPLRDARNSGIRVGISGLSTTGGGVVKAGYTAGNMIKFGIFSVKSSTVVILENLEYPLLGADILNKFQISIKNGFMTISP